MTNWGVLLAGVFHIAALIYLVVGIYLLYINIDSRLNKLAFLFCTSLSCWCFGLALSLMAKNGADSFAWARFSAIGGVMFYCFFLHYIIILAQNDNIMKIKWIKYAIYIPAFVILCHISIAKTTTRQLYNMQQMSIGWINISVPNIWITLYDVYFVSFMIASLFLIYQWRNRENDGQAKKQANTIFISWLVVFLINLIAEALDDFNINHYLHLLTPLVFMIAVINVCCAIKKHNFMKASVVNEDLIFVEQFRTKIIKYLAIAFCVGGVIYIFTQYLHNIHSNFIKVFGFAICLFLFGFAVYFVQKNLKSREIKIIIYSILLSASIPIISLRYCESAAVTVWAFPFIIMIAALLFNNSTILTMVSTSMILTQLYLWIRVPDCTVTVDVSDYFARVGLIALAIFLIQYINKIYLLRLRQLSDKIQTQDLLFLISSRSIRINCDTLNDMLNESLSLFCEYANADRAHICYYDVEDVLEQLDYYCWYNDQGAADENLLKDSRISTFSWWRNEVKVNGIVKISDVSKLPNGASDEKEFLMKQNVKSMLAVPIITNEKRIGYIRIDFVNQTKTLDDAFTKLLMTIGNILGEWSVKANSERKLEQMAYYDQLTNLPNRELFGEYINKTLKCAGQRGHLFSVIFLNLDSFKIINDTLGHHYGDKILVLITQRLIKCLRKSDFVCRFGGDEFLILINDILTNGDVETVVSKILKQFEKPFLFEGQEFYITTSIGISVFPLDGMDKDTLIKNADIAMHKAKRNGKNQFIFCSEEMKEEIQQTMFVTNNLHYAKERGELRIQYQPQVLIETGRVVAVEALMRWEHPELGLIAPSLFIPIAEHTGLINTIGEWILEEACKQNKIWQQKGLPPIRMAVNVSVRQLLSPNFVSNVRKVLEENQLDPYYLELEVTENIAIQESDYIFNVLSDLKKLGISLAIDDFGIEYSSLNRIKMLPIDRLKIDMHFIRGILTNEKDKVIVDVIIKLAKDLNLKVIAEGVEQVEQLEYLKNKNCDEVQGYYFYQPLSDMNMEEVLRNSKNYENN